DAGSTLGELVSDPQAAAEVTATKPARPKRHLRNMPITLQRTRLRLDQFDIQRDFDDVADRKAACFEDLIPQKAKFFAADGRFGAETGAFAAPRVFLEAMGGDIERHFAGDVLDGEVP